MNAAIIFLQNIHGLQHSR